MPTITNRMGLPEVLVRALTRDPYTRGKSDFSVTQLIDSPRIRVLRQRHADEIVRDVADNLHLLLGKSLHHILEHGASQEDAVVEERAFAKVYGHIVSGQMDVQHTPSACHIIDWKLTSVATVGSVERTLKWEQQLNCYAALRRLSFDQAEERTAPFIEVASLTAVAFLYDWKRKRADDPAYPQAPIVPVRLPLWRPWEQEAYISERVRLHAHAEYGLPECSDEDRWKRSGGYEIVQITQAGREWVREKFSGSGAHENAHQKMEENRAASKRPIETWVRPIPAYPVRCAEWCEVASFCEQWQREKEGIAPLPSTHTMSPEETGPAKAQEV